MSDHSRDYQGHFRLGPWHLAWALVLGPSWSAGGHIVIGGPSIIPRDHRLILMTGVVTAFLLICSGLGKRRQLQSEEDSKNERANSEGSRALI